MTLQAELRTPEDVAKAHRYEVPVFCLAAGVRQVHVHSLGPRKGYCVQAFFRGEAVETVLVLGRKWLAVDRAFEIAVKRKIVPDFIVHRARARVKLAALDTDPVGRAWDEDRQWKRQAARVRSQKGK